VARFREVVEIEDQLLRNEVTTYMGRYYSLTDAVIQPTPVQWPRPPITIGALGPVMLQIAARYANTWNSFGGLDLSSDEMLEETQRRNALLDDYCTEIGRALQTLRRSLLVFGQEAMTIFNSVDAFKDVVRRYYDVGITEFILYYPWKDEQLSVFKRIARDIIPKLRATSSMGDT